MCFAIETLDTDSTMYKGLRKLFVPDLQISLTKASKIKICGILGHPIAYL